MQPVPQQRVVGRWWRGRDWCDAALLQFAGQHHLSNCDERLSVGGNLQEFRIRHGRVIGAERLLLSSHVRPPWVKPEAAKSNPETLVRRPETGCANNRNRNSSASRSLKPRMPPPFR